MYGRLYVTRITLQDFVLRADADHISGVLNLCGIVCGIVVQTLYKVCSTYVVLWYRHCKVCIVLRSYLGCAAQSQGVTPMCIVQFLLNAGFTVQGNAMHSHVGYAVNACFCSNCGPIQCTQVHKMYTT